MVTLAKNWATVGPQHQCVHPILTEPRLVNFQALLLLSLIDVSGTLFEAGAPPLREAILQPHTINQHPLHLSNLQRHREQAGVQQERGCLLGTTRVRQLSGTRSGSPQSVPQPEREISHSSHQPTGHTLHPAVPQVHSKQNNKNLCLSVCVHVCMLVYGACVQPQGK